MAIAINGSTIRTTPSTVIVVGAGNAALCAALSAHEAGAHVIVLEAAPKSDRGGNSRYSGAAFRGSHDGLESVIPLLCQEGLADIDKVEIPPYPAEKYTADLLSVTEGRCDIDQVKVLTEESYDTLKWMKDAGCQFTTLLGKYIDYSGGESGSSPKVQLHSGCPVVSLGDGVGLVNDLFGAVERAGIPIYYETPAHDLIMRGDTCLGVRVRLDAAFQDLPGRVILACGGFEANPRMRRQYLGEGWELVAVRGTMRNQGIMLEKALAAGAQACGDWGHCHASPQDINAPLKSDLAATRLMHRYSYPYSVSVNNEGKRFMDEGENQFSHTYAKTGSKIRAQPMATAFQIFDQKVLHLMDIKRYSKAKKYEDDTLQGLAVKLGIKDPIAFESEILQFNAACQPGNFEPMKVDGLRTKGLAIPKSNWALPINEPPYVGYAVTTGITFTYGGIKGDLHGRVVNNEDKIMPGLYACGEMTGGLFYFNYSGGAGLMKGSVFGRRAGRAATTDVFDGAQSLKVKKSEGFTNSTASNGDEQFINHDEPVANEIYDKEEAKGLVYGV